jgi:hypothetical protein
MRADLSIFAGPIKPPDPAALADHFAVCQLARVYTLGVDQRDLDLVKSVFSEDGVGEGALGKDPFSAYLPKVFNGAAAFHATQHNITSQNVHLDGDKATVWSYAIAYHIEEPGNGKENLIVGVTYRDQCRRTPKGWLIVERKAVLHWKTGPLPK